MSSHYIAWINEGETSPMTLTELLHMAAEGKLVDGSPVRQADDPNWSTLAHFSKLPAPRKIESKTLTQHQKAAVSLRDKVRETTAYRTLRGWISIFCWLNLAGIPVFAILIFADSQRFLFYISGIVICIAAVIPLAVATAMVDLADCALRKEARDA